MAKVEDQSPPFNSPLIGKRWWLGTLAVLAIVLLVTIPTTGDFGLTWDEPSYRYSQLYSIQWWERLSEARSWSQVEALLDPQALLYYWPYARYGINFHPPLAGQLNLLTYQCFGSFMKDIPARRMASVFEYALTVTLLFGFLARRYSALVGLVAAAALLTMPRLYGDGHIAATDTPGLFLWAATSLAFWKGLHDPKARVSRTLVGVFIGLAFVEKMSAMGVLIPLLFWFCLARLPRAIFKPDGRSWLDGLVTTALLLAPSGIAFVEINRIKKFLPPPAQIDVFKIHIASPIPGVILLAPLAIWLARHLLLTGRRHREPAGPRSPALEVWFSILACGPAIAWLGNPAWWRETLPRLAHYYMLNTDRQGALPNIQILYFGQVYEYSLPVGNAFVLMAITTPVSLLVAGLIGLCWSVFAKGGRSDPLPRFFLLNLLTLPVLRMFPTPAHDGVRLFLPTFFFLAAYVGWGVNWVGAIVASIAKVRSRRLMSGIAAGFAALAIVPAAWQLIQIHPYELSYYNELIGGPRGAWNKGFELAYWYDAFNDRAIAEVNRKLPPGAMVDHSSKLSMPPTFLELQSLGALRKDVLIGYREGDPPPFMWLLTQDSKATALTRLMFVMEPFYALRPRQLDGLRVFTIASPVGVSRALALQVLLDGPGKPEAEPAVSLPSSLLRVFPWLARFQGVGLIKAKPLGINEALFDWARRDPKSLRAAATAVAAKTPIDNNPDALKLYSEIERWKGTDNEWIASIMLTYRPESIVEAVEMIITKPEQIRKVMLRYAFTDPDSIGGYLDQELPGPKAESQVR